MLGGNLESLLYGDVAVMVFAHSEVDRQFGHSLHCCLIHLSLLEAFCTVTPICPKCMMSKIQFRCLKNRILIISFT